MYLETLNMSARRKDFVLFILIQLASAVDFTELSKLGASSFGHTYITRQARSAVECGIQCLNDGVCNSVTFTPGNGTCELHNRSPADFPYANVTAVPNKDLYYINPGRCQESWILYDRHCYIFTDQRRTWEDSEDNCLSMGAHLTDITDAFENSFVTTIINNALKIFNNTGIWIGIGNYYSVTPHKWTSGRSVEYTNWASGRPDNKDGNEDCIRLRLTGSWNDRTCDLELPSVCKKRLY